MSKTTNQPNGSMIIKESETVTTILKKDGGNNHNDVPAKTMVPIVVIAIGAATCLNHSRMLISNLFLQKINTVIALTIELQKYPHAAEIGPAPTRMNMAANPTMPARIVPSKNCQRAIFPDAFIAIWCPIVNLFTMELQRTIMQIGTT